jgi:hypothetical protein
MIRVAITALAMSLCVIASRQAAACDLRLESSTVFENSCKVLVGYSQGKRVGPFHINLPDGSVATVGTCEGYAGASKVEGGTVWTDAFHTFAPHIYSLADDCRSVTTKAQ